MAIPFLQPEDDESARQQHAATQSGIVPASPGIAGGPGTSNGVHLLPPPPPSPLVVSGSIPIPGSPAPLGVPPPSGTSTAVQTPLLGPGHGTLMHGDQLVQLFYEALYRYSRGDTPSTPISQSPQSSSCSPFTTGYYNSPPGGQVFFPQTPSGVLPRTPNAASATGGRRGGARIFFGQPTPSPSGSSSHSSQHSANSPDAGSSLTTTPASCSSAGPIFHSFPSSYSGSPTDGPNSSSSTTTTSQLASSGATSWPDDGSESSESDSSQPSSSSELAVGAGSPQSPSAAAGCSSHCLGLGHLHQHRLHHHQQQQQQLDVGGGGGTGASGGFIPPHLDFMAGREQLQEFAGKIPQRKKKSKASKSKKAGFLEQTLVWPTLAVTATLIALGCGLLAAR